MGSNSLEYLQSYGSEVFFFGNTLVLTFYLSFTFSLINFKLVSLEGNENKNNHMITTIKWKLSEDRNIQRN